ncbi:MAG: ArnT family glycosyltransferase [Bryobacteraceae bacterium]
MPARIRRWLLALIIAYLLFFFHLSGVGLLGPDEPRYASIGREMAASGDWITPRLWGDPWFEKPALIYWLIAAGHRAGLGPELAPRLPVALLSAAFLAFYFFLLRREFGPAAALYATAILATAAGWVAYSQVAVTDLPLAAAFSAALLLSLGWIERGGRARAALAGAFLGLAVLAKGLVPLALAAPLLWMARRPWRDLWAPALAFLMVAVPWYAAVTLRHGGDFLDDFFWRHHFQRFASEALQHQQPFWFYVPVLVAGLFPWTPLLVLIRPQADRPDPRRRLLLLTVLWGFAFFSLSTNKLPGYLLPLFPSLCALLGLTLSERKHARLPLALSAFLLGLVPLIGQILPQAVQAGLSRSEPDRTALLFLLPALGIAVLIARLRPATAVLLLAAASAAGVAWLKVCTFPALDAAASARPLWRVIAAQDQAVCVEPIHRNWRYGLNYYSNQPLPDCETTAAPRRVRQVGRLPVLE